jgi:hypothetical protein
MAKPSKQAQAIIELAIFGAVLLFLGASIASVYLNGSFYQNAMLQSMRKAMYMSYTTANAGYASRTGATYMIFEDRLSGDADKFGGSDRQPVMMTGSGSFTKNMMLPVDWDEGDNLPVMDVNINGQEFHFTTTSFMRVKFFLNGDTVDIYKAISETQILADGTTVSWKEFCPGNPYLTLMNDNENFEMRKRLAREWNSYGIGGYPPMYTNIVANNADWNTLDLDRMYDYNRNGDFTDDFPDDGYRDNYATWQWYWKDLATVLSEIDTGNGSYPAYDVNGDMQEETIYAGAIPTLSVCGPNYGIAALTPSAGDWNTEKQVEDFNDPNNAQGMRSDMRIYSKTTDASGNATYLDIKEIKTNNGPFNISLLQKRQADIVERVLQLNPQMADVQGFLDRNPVIVSSGASASCNPTGDGTFKGAGCGYCFGAGTINQTCFDTTTKTLYIRSNISDQRGRKWTTSTNETFNKSLGL